MQRYKHPDTHTYRQIEKHRQTDRQTGRQTDNQADRQSGRQAGRKAGKRKVTKLGGQGGRRAPRHTDK
jgi:hypothetical protein